MHLPSNILECNTIVPFTIPLTYTLLLFIIIPLKFLTLLALLIYTTNTYFNFFLYFHQFSLPISLHLRPSVWGYCSQHVCQNFFTEGLLLKKFFGIFLNIFILSFLLKCIFVVYRILGCSFFFLWDFEKTFSCLLVSTVVQKSLVTLSTISMNLSIFTSCI